MADFIPGEGLLGWENPQVEEFNADGGFLAGLDAYLGMEGEGKLYGSGGAEVGGTGSVGTPTGETFYATGGFVAGGRVVFIATETFAADGGVEVGGSGLAIGSEFNATGGGIAGGATRSWVGGDIDMAGGMVVGGDIVFVWSANMTGSGGGLVGGTNYVVSPPTGRVDDDSGPRGRRIRKNKPTGEMR
jgi:hypothetical protein